MSSNGGIIDFNKKRKQATNAQPMNVIIPIAAFEDMSCVSCDCTDFTPTVKLGYCSQFHPANPTNQPVINQIPGGFRCCNCGAVNQAAPKKVPVPTDGTADSTEEGEPSDAS